MVEYFQKMHKVSIMKRGGEELATLFTIKGTACSVVRAFVHAIALGKLIICRAADTHPISNIHLKKGACSASPICIISAFHINPPIKI